MTTGPIRRVGMVGLGAMGRPIAERIADAGFEVVGYDRSGQARAAGVTKAAGLDEIAATDLAIVIVPTDDDVTEVVAGDGGLIRHGHPGLVIMVSASVRPETCQRLAALATGAGMHLLDAALTGGIRGAESGTINLLVGGDPTVVERVGPVLHAFCANHHVLGAPGAGQVGKTASNLIHWAEIVAIDEAFRLAATLGVAPAALRAALQHGGTDSRTMRELELMHFTWYAKDIAIARQMADEAGVALPVANLARGLMDHVSVDSVRELLSDG
jgi:3-hydroxyisobutyrate dehydrogenase-like beta-hydroxyacid dehydrogenase